MEEQTQAHSLLNDPDFRELSWRMMLATIPWTQPEQRTREPSARSAEHAFNSFNYRRTQR